MTAYSDKGAEWEIPKYKSWGITPIFMRRSPIIEAKNSHFQRVFYKIVKMRKTRDITKLTDQAMKIINRTQSSITKKAPIENIKETTVDLKDKYNRKKGQDSGVIIKRKALKKGDMVRVQLIYGKDKDKGYKAYRGKMWSKRLYPITNKRGQRYTVNKKSYHRDEIRETAPYDRESEKIIKDRTRIH